LETDEQKFRFGRTLAWPWPSPDLNPIDYKIWGIIQQRFYQAKVQDVKDLMQRLIDVWAGVETALLMMPFTSGAGVCVPAFEPQEDILNTHCDIN